MDKITIKLLHERRNSRAHRKIDGRSGKLYLFQWSDQAKAYCFTTDKQIELEDIFGAQGRRNGAFFAPVIVLEKPPAPKVLPTAVTLALLERDLIFEHQTDYEKAALLLLAAYDKGRDAGVAAAQLVAPETVEPPLAQFVVEEPSPVPPVPPEPAPSAVAEESPDPAPAEIAPLTPAEKRAATIAAKRAAATPAA